MYTHVLMYSHIHTCVCACAHTPMHAHMHTHTRTLRLPVYPNPPWKVSAHPTKRRWVTCLQTLNLVRQENPRRVDGSRTIAAVGTWFRCKHHLMHCMCMHDESPLLACKTNARDPWPNWSPPHGQGQGATISHIIRQDDVTMSTMRGLEARTHTHTLQLSSLVKVAQHIYSIP